MKEGARQQTHRADIVIDNDCVDVTLAGIRIRIQYNDSDKEFFVAVGAPNDPFSGEDHIPLGKLYDALKPLAKNF